MLKVINYDGFYKDLNEWVTEEDKQLPPNKNWYVSVLMTAEDNEIKAIPIEWLKKHKYSNVIDLWEKECRLKTTENVLNELLSEHNFKSYNDYVEYAGKITSLPRDDRLDILFKEKENG